MNFGEYSEDRINHDVVITLRLAEMVAKIIANNFCMALSDWIISYLYKSKKQAEPIVLIFEIVYGIA